MLLINTAQWVVATFSTYCTHLVLCKILGKGGSLKVKAAKWNLDASLRQTYIWTCEMH